MSQSSPFAELHLFLSYIALPGGVSWNEVMDTTPCLAHCYWSLFFTCIAALLQLWVYLVSQLFVRRLIGYDKYPPLPSKSRISHSSYYLKLGQHVRYKRHIKIDHFDMDGLSRAICDGRLAPASIASWFVKCNEFHARNRYKRVKFREYLFPMLVQSLLLWFGCKSVGGEAWLYDRSQLFDGWPSADMKLLFLFNIGYYAWNLLTSILTDRHIHNLRTQQLHHAVSLLLLLGSYNYGFLRIGTVVLLLHYPADIALQSAKLFKMLQFDLLCNFAFALLCVIWLSTRIIIFPYHCILSGVVDFWNLHPVPSTQITLAVYALNTLLCVLYALHLHWFKLLIASVARIVKGDKVTSGSDVDQGDDRN